MRIAMIGTGYVGLVSGACFADFGHHVDCVDKDAAKIDGLNAGHDADLGAGARSAGQGQCRARPAELHHRPAERRSKGAEAVFIAVGTPARRGDGHADLSFVFDAVRELAEVIKPGTVVVTKSTVPVGTGDEIAEILAEEGADRDVSVASNPEFLREGAAIADFKHPDRIVVGAEDEQAREVLREIYRPLFLNQAPILFTGRRTAELTKYAANAFLATKISFINEIADLCEAVDADVQDVARGIGLDNRIGAEIPPCRAGLWRQLLSQGHAGAAADGRGGGGRAADRRDRGQGQRRAQGGDGRAGRLARSAAASRASASRVLGLAFKPNTDDMREAPSIPLIKALVERGAEVAAFDPVARRPGGADVRRRSTSPTMPMPPPTVPTRW